METTRITTEDINYKIINRSIKSEVDITPEEEAVIVKELKKDFSAEYLPGYTEEILILYLKHQIYNIVNSGDFFYSDDDGVNTMYELAKAIKEIYN
jgi:hypothetical protein